MGTPSISLLTLKVSRRRRARTTKCLRQQWPCNIYSHIKYKLVSATLEPRVVNGHTQVKVAVTRRRERSSFSPARKARKSDHMTRRLLLKMVLNICNFKANLPYLKKNKKRISVCYVCSRQRSWKWRRSTSSSPPTLLLKRLVSRHRVTHSHNLRLAAGLARRNRFSTAALVVVGGAGSGVCGRTNQSGVLLQWQYFTCMY